MDRSQKKQGRTGLLMLIMFSQIVLAVRPVGGTCTVYDVSRPGHTLCITNQHPRLAPEIHHPLPQTPPPSPLHDRPHPPDFRNVAHTPSSSFIHPRSCSFSCLFVFVPRSDSFISCDKHGFQAIVTHVRIPCKMTVALRPPTISYHSHFDALCVLHSLRNLAFCWLC